MDTLYKTETPENKLIFSFMALIKWCYWKRNSYFYIWLRAELICKQFITINSLSLTCESFLFQAFFNFTFSQIVSWHE